MERAIVFILIALMASSCSPKLRGHDYKVEGLPGVRYKKDLRPPVVKHICISIVIGLMVGPVISEEINKMKTKNQ
jgi:hypothetical protein